jgi:hypothetical protein
LAAAKKVAVRTRTAITAVRKLTDLSLRQNMTMHYRMQALPVVVPYGYL